MSQKQGAPPAYSENPQAPQPSYHQGQPQPPYQSYPGQPAAGAAADYYQPGPQMGYGPQQQQHPPAGCYAGAPGGPYPAHPQQQGMYYYPPQQRQRSTGPVSFFLGSISSFLSSSLAKSQTVC